MVDEKVAIGNGGVRISTDLTFSDQIALAVASGSRMAGWALRTFRGRGRYLILTILCSLILRGPVFCTETVSLSY